MEHLLNQTFSKVYVLTLARATDRHALFNENFKGLEYEMVYGTDRRDINFDNPTWKGTNEYLLERGIDLKRIVKKYERFPTPMHPGEVACSLGHLAIYKKMVEKNLPNALIMEDDAIWSPTEKNQLADTLKHMPSTWDLLYLGYRGNETPIQKPLKLGFYSLLHHLKVSGWGNVPKAYIENLYTKPSNVYWNEGGEHFCTHAYAVSLSLAKKLIEMQTPVQYISDRLLTFAVAEKKKFSSYAAIHKTIVQLEDLPGLETKSYINTD